MWQSESSWPERIKRSTETQVELRPHISFVHVIHNSDDSCLDFNKFSSWKRLLRVVATIYEFGFKLKKMVALKMKKNYDMPNRTSLLAMAENYIYRKIQYNTFKDEIACLLQETNIQKQALFLSVHRTWMKAMYSA